MKVFFTFVIMCFSFFLKGQDTFSTDSSLYNDPKSARHSGVGAIDVCFINFPMMKHNYNGINLDVKGGSGKWLVGFTFGYVEGDVTKDLSYYYSKPVLNHYEFGVVGMYKLVRTQSAMISGSLSMGVLVNTFGDDATRDEQTNELLDKVTVTTFYTAPGLDFSFRLFPSVSTPQIFFTSKIRYLLPAGYPKYGAPSDFTGYYLGVGITIIGVEI